jgi:proteasome lid subunit RPN8/RPN11
MIRPAGPGGALLRIDPTAFAHLRAHAEEAYPHECCGVLLGTPAIQGSTFPGWLVRAAVRAANIRTDSPHNRYEIAPAELVRILRSAGDQGFEIAGFYHSHPDHPAEPSATDLAEAHWLQCSYVITQVTLGRATRTASFRLAGTTEDDKRFEAEPIELVERA